MKGYVIKCDSGKYFIETGWIDNLIYTDKYETKEDAQEIIDYYHGTADKTAHIVEIEITEKGKV